MRTFLTLAPDASTALAIHKWCELCWPGLQRRIPVQNYHITVAFLGDTDDRSLQRLSELFDDFDHAPFEISLNQVGFWLDSEVLWLGCDTVSDSMTSLHRKCKLAANRISAKGGPKQYQPHLTLARKVNVPPPAALMDPEFTFTADALELWSSVRKPQGAAYSTLASWRFK